MATQFVRHLSDGHLWMPLPYTLSHTLILGLDSPGMNTALAFDQFHISTQNELTVEACLHADAYAHNYQTGKKKTTLAHDTFQFKRHISVYSLVALDVLRNERKHWECLGFELCSTCKPSQWTV